MPSLSPPTSVLIVGCGEFGSSLALALIKGAYRAHPGLITVLDRSATPPETDAACYDFNKVIVSSKQLAPLVQGDLTYPPSAPLTPQIVRQEYADPIYARLAHSAMELWRTPEWRDNYHECGVVVSVSVESGADESKTRYISQALAANAAPGMETPGKRAYVLQGEEEVRGCYPPVPLGDFAAQSVCECERAMLQASALTIGGSGRRLMSDINEAGGWANSKGAVQATVARLRSAGVRFVAGTARSLIVTEDMIVAGVACADGSRHTADVTVLCTGSWTPVLLPELGTELLPTGQVLATIQLSPEDTARYRAAPVTRLIDNGFYIFPPNEDGVLKFAIHQKGYLNPDHAARLPSVPRTHLSPRPRGTTKHSAIPAEARAALLHGLKRVYPELASKEWSSERMCWYSDRPSGDWLMDCHPLYKGLFVAAGCCGHAFKFMPLMGELILGGIEGSWTQDQKDIWAYEHRRPGRRDGSRGTSEYKVLRAGQGLARL